MTEDKKGDNIPAHDYLFISALASRIADESREAHPNTTVLDIALRMKADLLNGLDPNEEDHTKYLATVDRLIDYIKQSPDKTILDFIRENTKKH